MKIRNIADLNRQAQGYDSHAGATHRSRVEADRRSFTIIEGDGSDVFSKRVYYPRIKVLTDGSYIMFHQDGRVSGNCFYTKSNDGLNWTPRRPIFMSYKTTRDDGVEDFVYWCNCDAQVMPNGEILAFCSYRYRSGYNLHSKYSGIVMKRSTDNGESWSEGKEIYLGRNWESAPLLLKSGELQLYFSHTAPKFYYEPRVKTDAKIHTSSGSAIIRSYDGGETWTPDVKAPPYAAHRVTQSYVESLDNGTKCFTNQMPVAVELHNGDIALATESDMALGRFMLTMSYSHDNWARSLDIDEDGPEDKSTAFDYGAGPYIVQFESGETLLSYNTADKFHLRLGNEYGKNMTSERDIIAFDGNPGYWGCLCVDGTHRVLAAMPKVWEDRTTRPWTSDNDMMLCRYYLNHTLFAHVADNKNMFDDEAWSDHTDALFLGAETDSQLSLGFAHDDEYIYIRSDRLDRNLDDCSSEKIYMNIGDDKYIISRQYSGVTVDLNGDSIDVDCITAFVNNSDSDNSDEWGLAAIYAIKKARKDIRSLCVYAELTEKNEKGIVTCGFSAIDKENADTWFEVVFK